MSNARGKENNSAINSFKRLLLAIGQITVCLLLIDFDQILRSCLKTEKPQPS